MDRDAQHDFVRHWMRAQGLLPDAEAVAQFEDWLWDVLDLTHDDAHLDGWFTAPQLRALAACMEALPCDAGGGA